MKWFSARRSQRIGKGLVFGALLIGLHVIVSALPSGLEAPMGADQPPFTLSEENTGPAEATSQITPEEVEDFIASMGQADSGMDPFLSSGEQEWKRFLGELKDRPPRLQGIIQIKDVRIALIQNSRFREGDEVRGFRIIKIEDTQVLLTKSGKIYTVPLAE